MKSNHQRIAAISVLVVLCAGCSSAGGDSQGAGAGPGHGSGGTSGGVGTAGKGGAAGSAGVTSQGGVTGSGKAADSAGASGSDDRSSVGGRDGSGGKSVSGAEGGAGTQAVGGGGPGSGGGKSTDAGHDARGNGGNIGPDGRPGAGGAVDAAATDSSAGSSGSVSAGCVSGKTTSSCGKSGGSKCTLTSSGKTREYYLLLPTNYERSKSYPVVVELHGMIATAEMALSWFKDIPKNLPEAIYIAPQGLKHAEQGGGANGQEVTGWANVDGEDIQFMRDLVSSTQKDYCVDSQRVFAVGFSYGAMMSYAIGCELGGVFRAIAPMSGALLSGCNLSGKPIAMWGSHGTHDSLVSIETGRQARDKILNQNHCGTQTTPIDPSPCVAYQGCDQGYPVTWCEWDGDHDRPSFGSSAVAAFFQQF